MPYPVPILWLLAAALALAAASLLRRAAVVYDFWTHGATTLAEAWQAAQLGVRSGFARDRREFAALLRNAIRAHREFARPPWPRPSRRR